MQKTIFNCSRFFLPKHQILDCVTHELAFAQNIQYLQSKCFSLPQALCCQTARRLCCIGTGKQLIIYRRTYRVLISLTQPIPFKVTTHVSKSIAKALNSLELFVAKEGPSVTFEIKALVI